METTLRPLKARKAKPRGTIYVTEEAALQAKHDHAWEILSKVDPEELRKIVEKK